MLAPERQSKVLNPVLERNSLYQPGVQSTRYAAWLLYSELSKKPAHLGSTNHLLIHVNRIAVRSKPLEKLLMQ